jgi:hypothetical protein
VYIVARLREVRGGAGADDGATAGAAPAPAGRLLHTLREEVPWLGSLLGSSPRDQGQRRDGE